MIFSSNLLRSGAWRRNRALVWVLGLLLVAGIGWWQEKWLWEQYHWRMVMRPSVLTLEKEKAARPGAEFMECHIGCPTMVVIPAGKYMMGSPAGQGTADEQPAHEVTIARPFAAGKYEVSFAQWDACVDSGACPRVADGDWGRGDQPVINVSWDEAKQYARWLVRAMRRSIPSATTSLNFTNTVGTAQIPKASHNPSAGKKPTHLLSMTCTAMCGNGLKTSGTPTMKVRQPTARLGWRKALFASRAVDLGTTVPIISAQPAATDLEP
jgi:Sulfatase-modifying factor enzyme 1